jgi:hypothetical protein
VQRLTQAMCNFLKNLIRLWPRRRGVVQVDEWGLCILLSGIHYDDVVMCRFFVFLMTRINQILKKEVAFLSGNTEAIDDNPVFYKNITPQAIALCHFNF